MTANMFSQLTHGPKEGRIPSGLLSPAMKGRRRRFSNRQRHAFIFGTVLLIFVIYFFLQQDVLADLEVGKGVPRNVPILPKKYPISTEDMYKQSNSQSQLGSPSDTTPTPEKPIIQVEEFEEEPKESKTESKKAPLHSYKPKTKEEPHLGLRPERPTLKDDLEAIFALQPDEINEREYLRPINEGGAGRMRELGLRTRVYAKYLSAWEKLHLVEDAETGETSIRDDVIQYLRSKQEGEDSSLGLSITDTIHKYEAYRGFLAKLSRVLFPFTSPYFADHMSLHAQFKNAGRGIVLTAGDGQANYLLTTIYTFRKLGCDLPIEIMYLGDSDLDEDHRFELEALPGVTTRDISQMVDDDGWELAGWAIKPFAMLMSSFREVIFIDADSFFLRNPAELFDDYDYKQTGALFFRDRTIMPESKRKWLLQVLPRPIHKLAKESSWWVGTSGHYQESGVVVIDKWKHFVSLLLICRFNGSDRDPSPGKMGVYEMMHGDKETFWIGFLLAGDPLFAFHKGAVGSIGVIETPNATKAHTDTGKKETATKIDTDMETETDVPSPPKESPDTDPDEDEKEPKHLETRGLSTPDTYTICSPQLLHLDLDGKPLWFNGWILVNKYADRSRRQFAPMESYLKEPPRSKHIVAVDNDDDSSEDFWKLTTDNMCCLTSDAESKADLTEQELSLLKMMRDRAIEVGIME
ncbi:glycosyltransferase family 71 protein [Xylaria bambusicola]|uniref:glycosyltransferase family 71 protein n=1 Tax=Xylaria bambusicola TaxID=326684 RepID=UPI00200804C2|nr:glycosyltransferase family 71 protein [Xylaria bambusicola]KAI0509700.1 glycosyltransferase family 71 protein [Xylaria bambusicola]